jgi:hypothetical protein
MFIGGRNNEFDTMSLAGPAGGWGDAAKSGIQGACWAGVVAAFAAARAYSPNAKKEDLDADTDFDRVRKAPEFLQFRASLPD